MDYSNLFQPQGPLYSTAGSAYNTYSGSGQNLQTLPGGSGGYSTGSVQDYGSIPNTGLTEDLQNSQILYPNYQSGVGETVINRPITMGGILAIGAVGIFAYMLLTTRR